MQLEERVRKRRLARRNAILFTQVELSGLLAVFIVLLIVFMLSPGLTPRHFFPVDLAVSNHAVPLPNVRKEDAIIVWIARDGMTYFRNYKTTLDDLPRSIREAVRDGAERKVYVNADARARYSDVEAVVDAIRQAGISDVVFLTQQH